MLEIESLHVGYGGCLVLQGVDLQVEPGETLALIGPNGAGKSTLIRAISGALPPHNGEIRLAGKNIAGLSQMEQARYRSVVPQARQLPGSFTVYQTVLLGRTPYLGWLGHPGKSDHEHVHRALEQTNASSLSDRLVGTLSGGEQQRVLLARALAQDTPVLLLDEPTTHLDLQYQSSLLNLVSKLSIRKNLAVLMVLHDLNTAGIYADRVALLYRGQIFAQGTPEEVLTRENLTEVFGVPVNVVVHPEYGTPLILPDGVHNAARLKKTLGLVESGARYRDVFMRFYHLQ